MNTITLTHTDGRDAVYKLSIKPESFGFLVVAEFGKRGVWTQKAQLSPAPQALATAKNLFDRKIAEKKTRRIRCFSKRLKIL